MKSHYDWVMLEKSYSNSNETCVKKGKFGTLQGEKMIFAPDMLKLRGDISEKFSIGPYGRIFRGKKGVSN